MLLAFTLLAASMTHLGDLADVVKADTMPSTRDFCVTGTVSYVLVFQDKLCHVLLEDGGVGVDVLGSFRNAPAPDAGDIIIVNQDRQALPSPCSDRGLCVLPLCASGCAREGARHGLSLRPSAIR